MWIKTTQLLDEAFKNRFLVEVIQSYWKLNILDVFSELDQNQGDKRWA